MPPAADGPAWTDVAVVLLTVAIIGTTVWQILYVRTQTEVLKRTLKLTQDAQRAWLGVARVTNRESWEVGKPANAIVVVKNSGDSPAISVQSDVCLIIKRQGDPLTMEDIRGASLLPRRASIVLPGEELNIPFEATEALSEGQLGGVAVGALVAHLFGEIVYEDVFRHRRHTTFARFSMPRLSAWGDTEFYNEMD